MFQKVIVVVAKNDINTIVTSFDSEREVNGVSTPKSIISMFHMNSTTV